MPTARGRKLAEELGIQVMDTPGRGGDKSKLLTLGVKAMVETEYPGCLVDIESEEVDVRVNLMCTIVDEGSDNPPERIAFELAVSSLRENVLEQLLRAGVDRFQVVVENTRSLESYKRTWWSRGLEIPLGD